MASDGLFDNLFNEDLLRIINNVYSSKNVDINTMLELILEEAYSKGLDTTYLSPFSKNAIENNIPFMGGKNDDTTIILAEIVIPG